MNVLSRSTSGKFRILNRSIYFWIGLLVILVIFLVALGFMFNNALIKVTYSFGSEARPSNVTLKVGTGPNSTQGLGFAFGDYAFVPRSSTIISAASNDSETIKSLDELPFFSIPSYHLTLEAQRKLQKVGSEGLGCNMENSQGVFSHNCGDLELSQIVRPDVGAWGAKPLIDDGDSESFARYKEGFLAFDYLPSHEQNQQSITYVIPTANGIGIGGSFDVPTAFSEDEDVIVIHTDSADPNAPFILSNITQGKFLLVKDVNAKEGVEFKKQANSSTELDATLCNLTAGQFVCYYGPSIDDHTNTQTHEQYRQQHQNGSLEIRNIEALNSPKVIQDGMNFYVDGIYQDATKAIYASYRESLVRIDTTHNKVQTMTLSVDTNGVAGGRSLYFTRGNEGIYEYVPNDHASFLRFRSSNLITGSLNNYNGEVLIDTFANTDDDAGIRNVSQIYHMTDTPLGKNERRLEDFLPYGDAESSIGNMDYDDKRIYVSIVPSYYRDDTEAKLHLDTAANNAIKEQITERLRKDGALENRQLIFNLYGTDLPL